MHNIYNFEASQAVTARPSVKVKLKIRYGFGSEKCSEMRSGGRREVEQGPIALEQNLKLRRTLVRQHLVKFSC
jgi:hypothetical protein